MFQVTNASMERRVEWRRTGSRLGLSDHAYSISTLFSEIAGMSTQNYMFYHHLNGGWYVMDNNTLFDFLLKSLIFMEQFNF